MPWHVTKSWQVHGHGVAHMSCGHSHAYSDVSLYCLQFAWHVSGGKCKFCIPVAWLAVKRASEIPTFKFQTWFFLMGHKGSQTSNTTKKKIQTAELWLSTTTRDWRFDYRRHAMLRPGVDVHHASIIETCVDRCFADNFSRVVAFLAQSWATRIPRRTIAGPAHRVRRLASIDAFHRYLGWFVGFGCSQRCQRVHWIYACFTDNQYDSQRCFVSQSLWVIMCAWYRFYLVHRVHVCFTDIEHDSQRCFVLQSLLLFRRVFVHRVRVCFTDFHRYDFGPFDV